MNHGRLEVRRFDAERLMLIGDARVLDLPVGAQTPYHPSMFSASPTTLALAGGEVPFGQRLASVNRTGAGLQTHGAEAQGWVRLAPRGRRRLARQRILKGPENPDIWVDDLERGTSDQITRTPLPDIYPVWSPDDKSIAFAVDTGDGFNLVTAAADGSRSRTLTTLAGDERWPSWTADGRIVFSHRTGSRWRLFAVAETGVEDLDPASGHGAQSPGLTLTASRNGMSARSFVPTSSSG